jgi:dTDP-4-dehydrorhamnose 3,5-epimerase
LRGLHLQLPPHAQGKLITVPLGTIYDVIVDVRPTSPSFRKWWGTELSEDNRKQLWIPPGFAHGFQVTSAEALVCYKCTSHHVPTHEMSVAWNDPDIGVTWPIDAPILSRKDAAASSFQDVVRRING